METFSWQTRTEEGERVVYQASWFGGWWQLTCAPKLPRSQRSEVEPQSAEFNTKIWEELLELLKRKYSRRRVAWELVQQVQDILAGKATNERRDRRRHER